MSGSKTSMFPSTDSKNTDINILILGESGVGKSTFINSFANYMEYASLEVAVKSKLLCMIPAKITVSDENYVERNIHVGNDINEDKEFGNSSTQGARSYLFNLSEENCKVRLIDTPGIGDARGIAQDRENFENILSYISRFEYLHAICFLLKPDVSVLNAYFKYCILHLLSRLEKSASNNIIFFFTNSRCTFFKPGQTVTILKRILDEDIYKMSGVRIPCSKQNTFFMDNEGFKYLVGLKEGIQFGDREKSSYLSSWNNSYKAVWDFLKYIKGGKNSEGLKPHCTSNTLSINEARRIIVDLSKPLTDISELIEDNILVINRHKETIMDSNMTIGELQKNLFVPVINLREKKLPHPATVCTAQKCSEICTIAGIKKYHYKARCHSRCYLTEVPQEMVGAQQLINCAAMEGTATCTKCGCNFQTHMHVYYETETYEDKMEDKSIRSLITNTVEKIKTREAIMVQLNRCCNEYKQESMAIKTSMAKFAIFLEENSIATYNDSYIEYLNYLINREKDLGRNGDQELLKRYTAMKKEYMLEKDILENARNVAKSTNVESKIMPGDIIKTVTQLYSLKHTGMKIKNLYEQQTQGRKTEHDQTTEYIHPSAIKKTQRMQKEKKEKSTAEKLLNKFKELKLEQCEELLSTSTEFSGTDKNKQSGSSSEKLNNQSKNSNKPKNKNLNNAQGRHQSGNASNRNRNSGQNRNNFGNRGLPNLLDLPFNQFGNQFNNPNQFGNHHDQFGNRNSPHLLPSNQFGNAFGNNHNQFPYGLNQFSNQPNPFGNGPHQFNIPNQSQFGNPSNYSGNNPNGFDYQPNNFANNQNQFGNNLNRFEKNPNQFGNNLNQFGRQPNQFGSGSDPSTSNFNKKINNSGNQNRTRQEGNTSYGNNHGIRDNVDSRRRNPTMFKKPNAKKSSRSARIEIDGSDQELSDSDQRSSKSGKKISITLHLDK